MEAMKEISIMMDSILLNSSNGIFNYEELKMFTAVCRDKMVEIRKFASKDDFGTEKNLAEVQNKFITFVTLKIMASIAEERYQDLNLGIIPRFARCRTFKY